MNEKRFQKTRIVDKWGGIYDSENDEVLDVNDVEHKLNEQQATIKKLQDLCGESDSENAKLRIENKEQQSTINLLLDLLYQSEETVINEYSSHIGEDMDKLDKIFNEKDIKEIERFVRGCDDE